MAKFNQMNSDQDMNVVGHLAELRKRLIITGVFFIACFIVAFIYVKNIYHLFIRDIDFTLNITSPADIIWIYITIAGIVAFALTIPILALQIWLFIKPALTEHEKKTSIPYIPAVFLLFVVGLTFGYLVFSKLILPFLLSMNDGTFNELFTVDKYFKFMFHIVLPFAIIFEIPIISMFLTSIGMITPQFMKKIRKYAYFVMVIIGAVITPPDFFLQIIVAIPLIMLYEASIYFSSIVYRKKLLKQQEAITEDETE